VAAVVNGGYILLARTVQESWIWEAPPSHLKIWLYIIMKCNHAPRKVGGRLIKRGQCILQYKELQDAAMYYVGYRKERMTGPAITKILRRFCEGNMMESMRLTRGILITVHNYEKYQDPGNYENCEVNDEGRTKETRSYGQVNPINKNEKNSEELQEEKKKKKKVASSKGFEKEFENIWSIYPPRKGRQRTPAFTNYTSLRSAGETYDDLLTATQNYAASREDEDQQYTKEPRNFFGREGFWRDWVNPVEEPSDIDKLMQEAMANE
jgi:hypothetical protein